MDFHFGTYKKMRMKIRNINIFFPMKTYLKITNYFYFDISVSEPDLYSGWVTIDRAESRSVRWHFAC